MKKIFCIMLVLLCIVASFAACGNKEQAQESSAADTKSENAAPSDEETTSEEETSSEEVSSDEETSEEASSEEMSSEEMSSEEASSEEATSEEVSSEEEGTLTGSWSDGFGVDFIFEEDGTGVVDYGAMGQLEITWTATEDSISISMDFDGQWADFCKDAPYVLNGDRLSITVQEADLVFTRK